MLVCSANAPPFPCWWSVEGSHRDGLLAHRTSKFPHKDLGPLHGHIVVPADLPQRRHVLLGQSPEARNVPSSSCMQRGREVQGTKPIGRPFPAFSMGGDPKPCWDTNSFGARKKRKAVGFGRIGPQQNDNHRSNLACSRWGASPFIKRDTKTTRKQLPSGMKIQD